MASTSASTISYNFVSEPDDALKCMICLEVAEEPVQHGECGRLFCENCLEKHGKKKPCPNCRASVPQYLKDGKSKREIKALQVKCKNTDKDCEWVGTVGTLPEHEKVCQYALVRCPKRCASNIMRKDLNDHLEKDCPKRNYTCEYCGRKGEFAEITQSHDKICKKKTIPCKNTDCTSLMERRALKRHLDTCEHTVVPCKYSRLGCHKQIKRKDISDHEASDNDFHLHVALENAIKSKEHNVTFKLDNTLESPLFYTRPNGYHMKIKLIIEDKEGDEERDEESDEAVSVRIYILKGDYDDDLTWPLVGKLSITVLNQAHDSDHLTKSIWIDKDKMLEPQDDYKWKDAFPSLWDLFKKTYYRNSTWYFKVSFESPNDKTWLQCTI